MHSLSPIKNSRFAGSTLVESLISLAVVGFGFAGFITFNSHQLRTVRSSHEVTSSNLCLQERVEQMRIATWKQLTDGQYLKNTFFASKPLSSAPISDLVEKLTITSYPDESLATPLIVQRSADGSVVLLGSGSGLSSQRTAKVLMQIQWTLKGVPRTRQSVAIVSNGGVNRMTLPAFGSVSRGTTSVSSSTPTPTPAPTPTPTPTPGNNGNGNGGTVGKPNGKG